ncbi:MAG: class I SAM-dependent rRNA methyltransferase, partial [Clostridia bacterium]|nr:class I SAM-dependent rRNA methyltransferase [Clostridia bacterium]
MTERNFPSVTVTPKAERTLRNGNPRVYDTEIVSSSGEAENGALVDVFSVKGAYLGTGFISFHSKIRVRIVSSNANETFSPAFWERRIRYALDYRRTVMGDDLGCCRLIFGESDGFPGLTVDRFSDILVTQVLSYGMEKIKDIIYKALVLSLREAGETINGVYERNDVQIRELEGLEQYKGWYEEIPHGQSTETLITENGI